MRRILIIVLLSLPAVAGAQAPQGTCDHEPLRTTLIGAGIGGVAIPGLALLQSGDYRIDPSERLIALWAVTAGASLGALTGHTIATHRCPSLPAVPDRARSCMNASLRGGLAGGFFGGLAAFDMSPLIMLPAALGAALGGRHFNTDHAMGMITAGGAAFGMSLGAGAGYQRCRRT